LNLPVTPLFSLFTKLISPTTKLFPILVFKAFGGCFSTLFQVIFSVSSLFLSDSLSDLFDVVPSCFRGNSNGPKAIGDRAEFNFPSEAILNDHLACGGSIRSIEGIASCVTHV
jgi:hypothetical protein